MVVLRKEVFKSRMVARSISPANRSWKQEQRPRTPPNSTLSSPHATSPIGSEVAAQPQESRSREESSSFLFVGSIAIRVYGITATMRIPPINQTNLALVSQAPIASEEGDCCKRRLHNRGPAIARCELSNCQRSPALHPCRMFHERNVCRCPREHRSAEDGHEFQQNVHRLGMTAR